jgi:hypothetical protein
MLRIAACAKRLVGTASFEMQVPAIRVLPRFYHERVVDHYDNPRNVGSFDKNDPTVGTGLVGAPACGDVMKLQIKVDENTGIITDACWKTFGCGSAIASSSVGRFFPCVFVCRMNQRIDFVFRVLILLWCLNFQFPFLSNCFLSFS